MTLLGARLRLRIVTWRQLALAWLLWMGAYAARVATLRRPDPRAMPAVLLLLWIPGLAAVAVATHRWRSSAAHERRGWLLLALAFLLWVAAEMISSFGIAFPALGGGLTLLADVVHLAGYPAILAALLLLPGLPQAGFQRLRFLLDMLIYAGAWGLLLWTLLISPLFQQGSAEPHDLFWAGVFPTLDLVLLMLLLWWQGQSRRTSPFLWLLAAATSLFALYNLTCGSLEMQGFEQVGSWVDLVWIAGIGLVAASALVRYPAPAEGKALRTRSMMRRRWQEAESRLLPIASALALIIYVVLEWQRYGRVEPVALWGSLTLLLLVVLREGVTAGQAELSGYATLVQNLGDPAFICSPSGQLLLHNPALQQVLGGVLPRRVGDFVRASSGAEPGLLADSLLPGAVERGWDGEVWVQWDPDPARGQREASGSRDLQGALPERISFPAWLTLRPLPRQVGAPQRLAGMLHNLTPQREQELQLERAYQQAETARQELLALSGTLEERVRQKTGDLARALEQLEEQNRALRSLDQLKSEFVALTSHELRTPLASIRAGLEFTLTDRQPIPGPTRATLELVRRETERLGRFVESILNLSALEAGRLPIQPAPQNLAHCVEAARTSLEASHGGAGSDPLRRLRVQIPADLPEVWADDQMLSSVLFHLLDNAVKYAPHGPIGLSAEAHDGFVDILVSDQGPGIAAEQQTQLLQMFSRLESADAPRVPGYGLGLYMSRRFVEAMGGEIELQSAPGKGMTVRVRLPVSKESP